MGSFNPATVTLEQAKTHSYELKVFEIYKQLQQYNIRLAIAKSLPTIIYTAQTPDPLNAEHRVMAFTLASVSRSQSGMGLPGSVTSPGKKPS